ncbi:hypothetical protein HMI55_004092 [Coelomomyces lativittatus]|nr:hypothetical protein HMI55_004092 [Coelomomyces lativittatus]
MKTRVVVNLDVMAADLRLRSKDLHDYVHQQLEKKHWIGQFSPQGQFIYIDPDRLAMLRTILERQGHLSTKEAISIFSGPSSSSISLQAP